VRAFTPAAMRSSSVSRSRSGKAPATAMKRLAARGAKPGCAAKARAGFPGHATARRRADCRHSGGIEARSRGRIGISDTAAMGRVMHPFIPGKPNRTLGYEREAGRVDGDVAVSPVDPSPAPERTEHCQVDGGPEADPKTRRKSEPDRHREIIGRIGGIGPRPVDGRGIVRHTDDLRLGGQDPNRPTAAVDHTAALRCLFEVACRHRL
jgi:hypothetical protein